MSAIPLSPSVSSSTFLHGSQSDSHRNVRGSPPSSRPTKSSVAAVAAIASQWFRAVWIRAWARPFNVAPFRIRILAVTLVLVGLVVSVLLYIRLRSAPSHSDTQSNCNRRATQLQATFDVQALALVRHINAYLSAIGNTTIPAFTAFVGLLNPDNTTVTAITLYQRVQQRQRAQWVADFAEELKPGNRNEIWTLPAVTVRPVHVAEMWPCIASIPISDTALEAAKVFPFIGFDPLGEPTRAAPLMRALAPERLGKPSMSSLIRYPSDGSLGFNIYARNLRPVATQSSVSNEVAIGAHFVVKDLFRGLWTISYFDYLVQASTVELLRTAVESDLLVERSVSLDVTIVDQRIKLHCFARPDFGVFAYRYGAHLAAAVTTIVALCFASITLQVHHHLARALESRGDLDIARSLIKSLQGRAQAILQAIDVPVAVVDVVGRMIPLNDPAREWIGHTASAAEGVNVNDVVDLPAREASSSHEAEPTSAGGAGTWHSGVGQVLGVMASSHSHPTNSPPRVSTGGETAVQNFPAGPAPRNQSSISAPSPPAIHNEPSKSTPNHLHSRHCSSNRHPTPPNPLIQSTVVSSQSSSQHHSQGAKKQLPFRPGVVQVNIRRPVDGAIYPAEISASGPFTVPDTNPSSLPDRSLSMPLFHWVFAAWDRLRARAKFERHVQVRGDSELALVAHNDARTDSAEESNAPSQSTRPQNHPRRQQQLSPSSLRRRQAPMQGPTTEANSTGSTTARPAPSPLLAQQVIVITDQSEAAQRANNLECAQADLAAAHRACTEMLLLLCHELRNPAHAVSGLLADTEPQRHQDTQVMEASLQLAQYLDQGALLLGQEMDSDVPGLPTRDWALVELVRTVCRHRCPTGLNSGDGSRGPVQVVADPRVLRMAPTGDPDHWQRMVRVLLGFAVHLGRGNYCGSDPSRDGANNSVVFVLSPAWQVQHVRPLGHDQTSLFVIPSEWRVRLDIRIPMSPGQGPTQAQQQQDDDQVSALDSIEDMQRVVEWTRQVAGHWSAEHEAVEAVPLSPPPPPDLQTWAGLHMLVLWRQLSAVAGKDPRLGVSIDRDRGGQEVFVVSLDVECHLVG